MTDGDQCRAHAAECFRLAALCSDDIESTALSQMGRQWTDLAVRMDADARAALKIIK
jgi:hypothetical protein